MLTRIILWLLVTVALFAQGMRIPGNRTIEGTLNYCPDAGSTDDYACDLSPAIASYVTGSCYSFKANTANTGAASINFGPGAKSIKKSGNTALSDNDIRVGQIVQVCYDGTNMQAQSSLGNSSGGVVLLSEGVTPAQIQSAMDALTSGGKVQIPAGTYLASSMLTIPNGVVLRGSGRDTIIKAAPGFNFTTNKAIVRIGSTAIAHGARLENLQVHGDDIANSVGVYSEWAEEQSGVFHVAVTHCKKYGIWWDGINTQNSSMGDIEVHTTTGDASTVPVFIDGALSFRGISGATIFGASGVPVGIRLNGLTSVSFDNIHVEEVAIGIEIGSTVSSAGVVVSNVVGGSGVTDIVKLTTVTTQATLLALTKNSATNAVNDVANNVLLTDSRVAFYSAGTGWSGPAKIISSNDNAAYFNDHTLLSLTNSSNYSGAVPGVNFAVSASGDALGYNQTSNATVATYNASTVTKSVSGRPSLVVRVTNQGSSGEGSTYEILTAPVGSTTLVSRFKILPTGEVVQKPPTSCSGLAAGTLWNDAGTPKICP